MKAHPLTTRSPVNPSPVNPSPVNHPFALRYRRVWFVHAVRPDVSKGLSAQCHGFDKLSPNGLGMQTALQPTGQRPGLIFWHFLVPIMPAAQLVQARHAIKSGVNQDRPLTTRSPVNPITRSP